MKPYKNNIPGAVHIAIKVPTAGGKTFIACNALHSINKHFNEGNPITQRMPYKRGFTNIFRVEYSVINVGSLNEWDGGEITPEALRDAGVIKNLKQPVKLLGDGDLNIALNVRVHKVSASAKQKIEAAGGTVTLIEA